MTEKPTVKIEVEPQLKAELKAVGGGNLDQWNEQLLNLVIRALPGMATLAATGCGRKATFRTMSTGRGHLICVRPNFSAPVTY